MISAVLQPRMASSGVPVRRARGTPTACPRAQRPWKYARLGVSELRRLRSLEDENGRLKRLVADLSLDKNLLTEALRKKV